MNAGFASALLDPTAPCPPDLKTWNASDPVARFNVYRNNVIFSLTAALRETFTATCALLGAPHFERLARAFVRAHPPRSPVLWRYGVVAPSFADFLADHSATQPYLGDVARLEAQRVVAYHATDADAVKPEDIAALLTNPQQLAALRMRLHPSVNVVRSSCAIASLWEARQQDPPTAHIDPLAPEDALVLREQMAVRVLRLSPGDADFIERLQADATVADAAEAALVVAPAFDLAAILGVLIRYGGIAALHTD